jgi:hypothetical protein
MNFRRWNSVVWLVLFAAVAVSACRKVYVVVPRPSGGYKPDTLRATLNGNDARVIFRFDTVTHTRIVHETDTLWKEGKQIIRDTVRLVRRDTVRILRRDTIRVTRVDTVRLSGALSLMRDTVRIVRRDTVRIVTPPRVDTLRINVGPGRADTVFVPRDVFHTIERTDTVRRVDTIRVPMERVVYRIDTVRIAQPTSLGRRQVDTVRVYRTDTLRLARVDTVRIVDTVRVASGRTGGEKRTLKVPPGQYPPEGQCRVWVDGVPPGRQHAPAQCDNLGEIPAGAFVLYGGEAWDFDFDWVTSGGAPAPIIALQKAKGRKP